MATFLNNKMWAAETSASEEGSKTQRKDVTVDQPLR